MPKSKPNKPRVFWYHYNKPASKKRGKAMWTVHSSKKCYIVANIKCNVSTATSARSTQPRAVVRGVGLIHIDTETSTAIITRS